MKQTNAFIPNYVHSFDASHIVLIVEMVRKLYNFNVITIHDCFGTQANYVEVLSEVVKESFVSMYFDRKCIDKFHNHILNCIDLHYSIDNNTVEGKNGESYTIPNKPEIGELEIEKILPLSSSFAT
jgi:DNA-directed RNA polymerase